jgi:aldehyde dehydrogenase family 9 protein A1
VESSNLLLAEIYTEADVPPGLFNMGKGGVTTGQFLCQHHNVNKVSFTGSMPTSTKVMELSTKGIKPVTMKLGRKISSHHLLRLQYGERM